MTQAAYAARRGVSPAAVNRAIRDGRLKNSIAKNANGIFRVIDPELADREWKRNSDYTDAPQLAAGATAQPASAPDDDDGDGSGSLSGAAARQKHWQAVLAEAKARKMAGTLVDRTAVERDWAAACAMMKTRFLGLPSRLKQQRPEVSVEVVTLLDGMIRETLAALAETKTLTVSDEEPPDAE
jgi:hypothetical protein